MGFVIVLAAALTGTVVVVGFYSLGLKMLVRAGRVPVVSPATFTDAITVLTAAEIKSAEKKAAKAARKNPLSPLQKRIAQFAAYGCFAVCAASVLFGIYLIVPALHG
ncbi:peptidase [Mycetocola manganoxydans]|uniref:Peptidase n=1 Tax=Mycetocola manganoxydans TaxID=699879 RepID=A0A3L6ZPU7_9MICO|nr:peptidase [Mycetocola manganoxydans]